MSNEQTELPEDGFQLTLSKPITVGGVTYTDLIFREPTVRDLRLLTGKAAQNDPITANNQLYSQLTDAQVPPQVFDVMPVREMKKITKWFAPFMDEETS